MDLTLNADQQALRKGLTEVLADVWPPERLRSASEGGAFDRAAWGQLADVGIFGVCVPELAGGMGLGTADAVVLAEQLGSALMPGPLVPTFLAAGRVEGADDGSAVVTALDMTASTPVVEYLGAATHVVLVADDGLRLVDAAQLQADPVSRPLDPLTPVSVVRDAAGLAAAGSVLGDADDAIAWTRRGAVLTSALQVGVARGALDLAVRYAAERTQFGRPIGSFQAIKHLLAESLVRVDLARAAVLVAALTLDDPGVGGLDAAVASAKVLADAAAAGNGRACVQVHGGMGFTWEVLAHLYVKRAWLNETAFGDTKHHALALAETIGAQQ